VKEETQHRHLLEAIEAGKVKTDHVNLYSIDLESARAIKQLRQIDYIDGTVHDSANGSVVIEGLPIITLKGKQYLEASRSKSRQTVWRIITIIGTVTIWAITIAYYWLHLRS
jgi:hypothetical protein